MHCRPCAQYQHMVVEQHGYYQYPVNDLQTYYSSSEHQEEENDYTEDEIRSETSGDQSPNTDMFHLAFVASQSSKLVVNAGELFNKIMSPKTLLANETNMIKNQIEQWLCMKQEYEKCIATDDSVSLQDYNENIKRSLERIEEVTETDEKTDESNHCRNLQNRNKNCSDSESEASDEEERSGTESEHADFLDRLDECMKKFKHDTDKIINLKKNDFYKLKNLSPLPKTIIEHSITTNIEPSKNTFSRRTSILPYSEMSDELSTYQKQNCNKYAVSKDLYNIYPLSKLDVNKKIEEKENFEKESSQAIAKVQDAATNPQKVDVLEMLIKDLRTKESRLKKKQTCLDLTYKQIEELKNIIKIKEQSIKDMVQRYKARNNANEENKKKRSKFEEKYNDAKRLLELSKLSRDRGDELTYTQTIKQCEYSMMHYERKIKDTKNIKQFIGETIKTIEHAESSLAAFKEQMEELKCRFQQGEKCKKVLENEILENQHKIKELEKKNDLTNLKMKEITIYDKSERYQFDFNIYRDRPNLDHLFRKKQVQITNISDKKERLRQDIINLRNIRGVLIDRKYSLISGQILMTPENQKESLYIGEYVEVIDAIIEQKNVMIYENESPRNGVLNQLRTLTELSYAELLILFDKYFYKVIDIEDSAENFDLQYRALEKTLDKQRKNELFLNDRQKAYEEIIHNFALNHCAEETSSSSYDNRIDRNKDLETLFKENQNLRHQLAYFESLVKGPSTTHMISSNSVQTTNKNRELFPVACKHNKTQVIRSNKKLIITKEE